MNLERKHIRMHDMKKKKNFKLFNYRWRVGLDYFCSENISQFNEQYFEKCSQKM